MSHYVQWLLLLQMVYICDDLAGSLVSQGYIALVLLHKSVSFKVKHVASAHPTLSSNITVVSLLNASATAKVISRW